MRIQFRRREIGECVSVIYRSDGVVLERAAIAAKIDELVGRYMASRTVRS